MCEQPELPMTSAEGHSIALHVNHVNQSCKSMSAISVKYVIFLKTAGNMQKRVPEIEISAIF
jgi:hypothetical protein